ncbi:MAG: recombination regulator RecX [Burkholderiales bacterium]
MKARDPNPRNRALRCLARREYSRAELRQKLLAENSSDHATLDVLLDELEARGWLSDSRFVDQTVRTRQNRFGSLRIAHELRDKGVVQALIDAAIANLRAGELRSARAVWQRKFNSLPANAGERAKQMRFLQSRGFTVEVIRAVVDGCD